MVDLGIEPIAATLTELCCLLNTTLYKWGKRAPVQHHIKEMMYLQAPGLYADGFPSSKLHPWKQSIFTSAQPLGPWASYCLLRLRLKVQLLLSHPNLSNQICWCAASESSFLTLSHTYTTILITIFSPYISHAPQSWEPWL